MIGLELVVILGLAIVGCGLAGSRLHVPTPVLLLLVGALLGFAPALRGVRLPPELMLLVFLPVLLYWESLTASLRDLRTNLSGVVLASTLLVVTTAAAVAATMHGLGLSWGSAWVLGAALAPTDATAVRALAQMLPRRNLSVLRAESLVNDGTALVVYGVAVGVTAGEQTMSAGHVTWLLVVSYGGGILAGALVAWLGIGVRRWIGDPLLGNVVVLVLPFAGYLLAELIGASGVLAVVVCGLAMSRIGPRVGRASIRTQTTVFLSVATYLLNAALFVLIGLEAYTAVRNLDSADLLTACLAVVVVSAVLFVVRLAFLMLAAYGTRLLDRRGTHPLRQVSNRARVVNTVAAFRGAVSLAVVLSVPTTVASGLPFPDRDLIVFVTAGVVTTTLVVQGLLLPRVIVWARLPDDQDARHEHRLADHVALEEALAALPEVAAELGTDPVAANRLRGEYEEQLRVLLERDSAAQDTGPAVRVNQDYTTLRLALLSRKRAAVLALRDDRRIDDVLLRQIQARLDAEELRLSGGDLVEE